MKITEEFKRTLPLISDEELGEIRCPTEILIEEAIKEFNRRADEIDDHLNRSQLEKVF